MGRILIDLSYIRYNLYAGVSKYAYRILDFIVEDQRCDKYVLLLNGISEKQIREWYPQFDYIVIDSGFFKVIPMVRTIILSIKFQRIVNNYDCQLVFCPWGNEISCLPVNKKKISVIHDLQLRIDTKGLLLWIHKQIDDRVIKYSDEIVTISEFSKQQIRSFYPNVPENFIVSLGNSLSSAQASGPSIIEGKYILYVGRICKMKNVVTLIKAYSRIASKLEGTKLVVVGQKNPYWSKVIMPILQANNLIDSVEVIENCSEQDLTLLYRYASLFVFPSLREGFGSPPLEAAIECTPVISTTCDSLEEVLMDKVFTYQNPMDDTELAEKMKYVLHNRPSDDTLKSIRDCYMNTYSISAFGKKVCDYLENHAR